MTKSKSQMQSTSRSERKVWLYMVDGKNVKDLEILDAEGFDTWKANPNTKAGDLILMYRTAPYSDIASVFVARGDARKAKRWYWPYKVDIGDGFRLPRIIKRGDLQDVAGLKEWDFLENSRGYTNRRDDLVQQKVWHPLRRLIEKRAPGISRHFGPVWTGTGKRRPVFLSYSTPDADRAGEIYRALSRAGIDVWLDRVDLDPAQEWAKRIESAINKSRAFVACVSTSWVDRRHRFAQEELKMALGVAQRKKRFMFPVLIDDCELPDGLSKYHAVRVYGRQRDANLKQLIDDIRSLR